MIYYHSMRLDKDMDCAENVCRNCGFIEQKDLCIGYCGMGRNWKRRKGFWKDGHRLCL